MEADISIWRKPGHFYFALTRAGWIVSAWIALPNKAGVCGLANALRRSREPAPEVRAIQRTRYCPCVAYLLS
jgi:hypothetical protein